MLSDESKVTLFATTRWTLVGEAARGGDGKAGAAWEGLFRAYWPPLYRYARRAGKSKEDAEDLVQGFLAHLGSGRALGGVDRSRGRFRAFLLASFRNWMVNEWKRDSRLKRGGGVTPLSLDWESAETGLRWEVADGWSPDRLFDRDWALALLDTVLGRLESVCEEEGMGRQFEGLKACLSADSRRIPYADLAPALGMSEGAVRVAGHRLRKRYRALLTEEVARTLASPEAVEEELRSLFAALAD